MLKRSFTFIEIMIVVIIIGVLASIAMVSFSPAKEKAFDNEAKANLKLIMAAEKIHSMEQADGSYFAGATAALNSELKLNLPTSASSEWAYSAAQSGSNCCVSAVRTGVGSNGRAWHILSNDAENVVAGGCS